MSEALIDVQVEARPGMRAEDEHVDSEQLDGYRPLPPDYSYKLRARVRAVISGEPLPYTMNDESR